MRWCTDVMTTSTQFSRRELGVRTPPPVPLLDPPEPEPEEPELELEPVGLDVTTTNHLPHVSFRLLPVTLPGPVSPAK